MTGSTISGTITTGITLGSLAYLSPLTITSTGVINPASSHYSQSPGIYVPQAVANATIINYGAINSDKYSVGVDIAWVLISPAAEVWPTMVR